MVGKLNAPVYRLTGGRVGGKVGKGPVLLLTTTGRKSGQQRTAPVVYLAVGDDFVVINTNAGNAKVPAWSLNLRANPEAEVEVGRRRTRVRARLAEGEERADLGAGTWSSTPAGTTTSRSSTARSASSCSSRVRH